MSLKARARAGVRKAFAAAGNLKVSASFKTQGTQTYNLTTKKTEYSGQATYVRKCLKVRPTQEELNDGTMRRNEVKLLLQATDNTWGVATTDEVTFDGEAWKLRDIKEDMADAMIVLVCEKR